MNMLNSILIDATLIEKPECYVLVNGTHVCTLKLQCTSKALSNEKTSGNEVVVNNFKVDNYGMIADMVSGYKEGDRLRVIGRLDSFTKKISDNTFKTGTKIISDRVELIARKDYAISGINQLIIEGELVNKPELQKSVKNYPYAVAEFVTTRTSINPQGEIKTKTSQFKCNVSGRQAELLSVNGEPGNKIRILGCIREKQWEDANGKLHSGIRILSEHLEVTPIMAVVAKKHEINIER